MSNNMMTHPASYPIYHLVLLFPFLGSFLPQLRHVFFIYRDKIAIIISLFNGLKLLLHVISKLELIGLIIQLIPQAIL